MSAQERSNPHTSPGGTDPMGKTEAPRPTAGAQEHLLPGGGPVNCKGVGNQQKWDHFC